VGIKGRKSKMKEYTRSTKEEAAWYWCFKNNLLIQPRQTKANESLWYIDIHKGPVGRRKVIGTSPEPYTSTEIWKKVSEYQLYYYNKYNNEK
jgi:hypothetical protein|tara:strand:+ start:271 stop:546 length:276 start_codon:yes stop_codon:yes gene_type:complete